MIVLDASAVLELLLRTPRAEAVEAVVFDSAEDVHVPALLDLEVVQVLRRWERGRALTHDRCREAFEDLLDLPLARHDSELLLPRVFELRLQLTACDATYVAPAEKTTERGSRIVAKKWRRCPSILGGG